MNLRPRFHVFACLALLALRLAIGWHFFKEGIKKVADPGFSARYFLQEATGPMAPWFRSMVEDPLGLAQLDRTSIVGGWDAALEAMQPLAGGKKEVASKLKAIRDQSVANLDSFFQQNASDMSEFLVKARKAQHDWHDGAKMSVVFEDRWNDSRMAELRQQAAPWLSDLRTLNDQFRQAVAEALERDVHSLEFPIAPSDYRKTWVDHAVGWTVTGVGVLLLIGLLVPLASIVGAGFLLSVMATQPFWVADANVTYAYYQCVEIAALLVLATTSAGRFAGLDFFWQGLRSPPGDSGVTR